MVEAGGQRWCWKGEETEAVNRVGEGLVREAWGSPGYKVKVQLFQVHSNAFKFKNADSMHLNDPQNAVTTNFVPIGNFLQI